MKRGSRLQLVPGIIFLSTALCLAAELPLAGRTVLVRKRIAFNGRDLVYGFDAEGLVPRTRAEDGCTITFKAEVRALPAEKQVLEPGTTLELGSPLPGSRQVPARGTPDIIASVACTSVASTDVGRAPASAVASPFNEFLVIIGDPR